MPRLMVNGAAIHYEDTGSGDDTIVFAHGLLWSGRMYEAQVAALRVLRVPARQRRFADVSRWPLRRTGENDQRGVLPRKNELDSKDVAVQFQARAWRRVLDRTSESSRPASRGRSCSSLAGLTVRGCAPRCTVRAARRADRSTAQRFRVPGRPRQNETAR